MELSTLAMCKSPQARVLLLTMAWIWWGKDNDLSTWGATFAFPLSLLLLSVPKQTPKEGSKGMAEPRQCDWVVSLTSQSSEGSPESTLQLGFSKSHNISITSSCGNEDPLWKWKLILTWTEIQQEKGKTVTEVGKTKQWSASTACRSLYNNHVAGLPRLWTAALKWPSVLQPRI